MSLANLHLVKQSKRFFFEKKKQKTFGLAGPGVGAASARGK
jgi:hypothetical protein